MEAQQAQLPGACQCRQHRRRGHALLRRAPGGHGPRIDGPAVERAAVGRQAAPAAPTDQLERMRSAFEKVVAQVQELGQHMLEVQSQAMAVLNECATKNLEVLGTAAPELAALQQKAKQRLRACQPADQRGHRRDEEAHGVARARDEGSRRDAGRQRQARRAPKPAPAAGRTRQACAAEGRRPEGSGRRPCRRCRRGKAEGDTREKPGAAAKPKTS